MSSIYGVHFGLNAIGFSPSKPIAPLRHAENDARAYHEIISKQGGKSKLFISSEATVGKFLEELINLSKTCSPNDLIVVTFSGHGTRVKDLNNDEEDGYDEVLVFYDRLLIDDLVKVQFSRFQEGVNIFFITDCCHSGTISKPSEKLKFRD